MKRYVFIALAISIYIQMHFLEVMQYMSQVFFVSAENLQDHKPINLYVNIHL